MQDGKAELNRVREARRLVEKVRGRLMHPTIDAMDRGAAELSAAVESLAGLETALAGSAGRTRPWPGWEPEVARLRREVRNVQQLLAGAGKFYAGWARLLAPDQAPANYTANGKAEQQISIDAGKVALHG
jgi:hypothetical protein